MPILANHPTVCPLCGDKELKRASRSAHGRFSLFGCCSCTGRFWWPLEWPGKDHYENSPHNPAISLGEAPLYWREKQFLESPPLRVGRLLEIGCGRGRFLSEVQKMGFEVWGVDVAESAAAFARQFYNLPHVYAEEFSVFAKRDLPLFDVICFFEVLEHQAVPQEFISLVKKLLRPEGYVALSVPNLSRFWGSWEEEDLPPNHFLQFTPRSLSTFMKTNGLITEKLIEEPFHADFFFRHGGFFRFGIFSSLRKRFTERVSAVPIGSIAPLIPSANYVSRAWWVFEFAGRTKEKAFRLLAVPIAFLLRSFGYKWWDMYGVARREN